MFNEEYSESIGYTEEEEERYRKRWFAWYPVLCHNDEGEPSIWVWLNYVWYEVYRGKNFYFSRLGDEDFHGY